MDKTQAAAAGQNGKRGVGRPALLSAAHVETLREFVKAHPRGSLDDATRDLRERCGVEVCSKTVRKALQAAGIVRVKPARQAMSNANETAGPTKRYGYTSLHRREATPGEYATCLTDAEWARVADLFERPAGSRGMPARLARRTLVNACCYVLRTGCSWRLLPTSFAAWTTVYKSFSRWALKGVFEVMQDRLRAQWRERLQRDPQPSAAVLDSQSTRISPQGGECGFDAGKKVKGRKRHLVVDTLGLLLAVSVTSASVQDRDGAVAVVAQACAKLPTLKRLYVDGAYAGQCAQALHASHDIEVEVVRHPGNRNARVFHDTGKTTAPEPVPTGFVVLPKRWVVERSFGWIARCRRLLRDFERLEKVLTGLHMVAFVGVMLRQVSQLFGNTS